MHLNSVRGLLLPGGLRQNTLLSRTLFPFGNALQVRLLFSKPLFNKLAFVIGQVGLKKPLVSRDIGSMRILQSSTKV
jgi:hypothetical protein